MFLTHTPQASTQKPRVNLLDLQELRTQHLPPIVVRLSCLHQLKQEGEVIKAKKPHLSEEVDFDLLLEEQRRNLSHLQLA